MKGTVKWFNEKKGYGYIMDEHGRDVFLHYSAINKKGFQTIMDGENVEFDCLEGPKGPTAKNVVSLRPEVIAERVHNIFEAKAIIREADEWGRYYLADIVFTDHNGKDIGVSKWNHYEQKHDIMELK